VVVGAALGLLGRVESVVGVRKSRMGLLRSCLLSNLSHVYTTYLNYKLFPFSHIYYKNKDYVNILFSYVCSWVFFIIEETPLISTLSGFLTICLTCLLYIYTLNLHVFLSSSSFSFSSYATNHNPLTTYKAVKEKGRSLMLSLSLVFFFFFSNYLKIQIEFWLIVS
jgi:hypothetical protein